METYFTIKTWIVFYLPAAILILLAVVVLFCIFNIKVSDALHKRADKQEFSRRAKLLEDAGYVKILLDDDEAYVHPDLAYSEESEIEREENRIFYVDDLIYYDISKIESAVADIQKEAQE